jgi:plasmid stability protein
MAAVSIRNLDDDVRDRLRVRAARRGHSMEAEIRSILTEAVRERTQAPGLAQALLSRFGALDGADLELATRTQPARAADLFE